MIISPDEIIRSFATTGVSLEKLVISSGSSRAIPVLIHHISEYYGVSVSEAFKHARELLIPITSSVQ